jgi:hypothetical protein
MIKLLFVLLAANHTLFAQEKNDWQIKPKMELTGFVEVFYVYDFNKPQNPFRQPFLYNYNRHNEFNLNLGFIKLNIEHPRYRSNLAIQTGTYPRDNYADEPGIFKNIFEANVGIAINRFNTLWIDMGILPSHIGFESALSMDNWTMTRSLLAENSPYYSTGAKLTYAPNETIEISCHLLNGWQRIQRVPGNSVPSIGTQILGKPTENTTLNWSTFIGTVEPDSSRKWRYFSDFYSIFKLSGRISLITGLDAGMQQKAKNSAFYDYWVAPVIIGKININDTWSTAIRAEYFYDPGNVVINPGNSSEGFKTFGLSVNFNYSPVKYLIWRVEGRWMNSANNFFERASDEVRNNMILGTTLAVKFSEIINK